MERPVNTNQPRRIMTDAEAAERAARKESLSEERRRKKRRMRIIRTVLLSLLAVVLIVGGAFTGILMYLQGQVGEYDDIVQCVQAPAMDYTQRYSFSAMDNTVSIRLDKNDIWWLIYQSGAITILEELDAVLAANNMRLTGMGISTQGSALTVDAEVAVLGNITLPMTAYCTITPTESSITFSVSSVKLGNGWGAPIKWLCRRCGRDPSALALSFSKDIHPILNDLRDIRTADGYLVLTCGMDNFLYSEALANLPAVQELHSMGISNSAIDVVLEHGASTDALNTVFTGFQLLPNSYGDFRREALALATSAAFTEYLAGPAAPYIQRFMPPLTLESVGTAHQELYGEATGRTQLLEALATSLNTAYVKGTVAEPLPPQPEPGTEDEDENDAAAVTPIIEPATHFVNNAITGSPALTMEQIAGDTWPQYAQWTAENNLRAVYLASFPDTTVQLPTPQAQPAEDDEDEEEAPPQPAFITFPERALGLLVRMQDGSFRLYYHLAALNGSTANQITYTLTSMELDAPTGEGYMSDMYIPTVIYPSADTGGSAIIEIPTVPEETEAA